MSSPSLARWIPAFTWVRAYDRSWLRGDVLAGVTLAAYLLPAALGDASLANLPPEAGLYACLFGGLVFWIFCGSRYTAASVTSAISLVIGSSLAQMTGGNTARFGTLAAGTALLVSLIAFIAWLVKAGVMVHFISESVMTGFKCGVALFLASTQLPKLFGFHSAHGSFWENAGFFFKHLSEANSMSLIVGGIALAFLIVGKISLKHKPVALFVVIGGIVAASAFSLETHGVKLIGAVPQGIPPLRLPAIYWQDLSQLLPLAFACFLLGAVETAAVGRMLVAKHGGRFDATVSAGIDVLLAGAVTSFARDTGNQLVWVESVAGRRSR
jgi:MFS superfamily sulfate permease-like transporter